MFALCFFSYNDTYLTLIYLTNGKTIFQTKLQMQFHQGGTLVSILDPSALILICSGWIYICRSRSELDRVLGNTESGVFLRQLLVLYTSVFNLYLRNLLTHTVNNLLQTLNNVKSIQYFVVKQKFNIVHIMCENFKAIPWVLCKLQLILFERVRIGSHKNWNLG